MADPTTPVTTDDTIAQVGAAAETLSQSSGKTTLADFGKKATVALGSLALSIWSHVARQIAMGVTDVSADVCGGAAFYLNRKRLVKGVRFYTPRTGASTIRVAIWKNAGLGGTLLAQVDIAVTGPGTYDALFATPVAIVGADLAFEYVVGVYYVSATGHNYATVTSTDTPGDPAFLDSVGNVVGNVGSADQCYVVSSKRNMLQGRTTGFVMPDTPSNKLYPVDPILST
jgi:hypothetical protein